ncbi:MAG: flagellar hook-length control protein FliK [Rhodospirillaceae bacterium]
MKIAAEVHLSTSSPQQRAPELVGGEERKSMFSGIFSMLGLGGHVSQGGEIQGQLPEMKSPDGPDEKTKVENLSMESLLASRGDHNPTEALVLQNNTEFIGPPAPVIAGRVIPKADGSTIFEVGEEFIGPPAPVIAGRVIPKADGSTISEVGEEFIGPPAPVIAGRVIPKADGLASSEKNENGLEPRSVVSPLLKQETPGSKKTIPMTEPQKSKWTEVPGPNAVNNGVEARNYGSEAVKIISSFKTTRSIEVHSQSETEKFDGSLGEDSGKSGAADRKSWFNQSQQVHSGFKKEPNWDQSNLTSQISDSNRALNVQANGPFVRVAPDGASELNKFDPISTADQNWSQKLIHQLHLNIVNGKTNSINLQLHPASLGLLNVNLRKVGDKIEILITTQTKAAMKLLTDSQPKIAMLLTESGVKLDAIRVLAEGLQENYNGSNDKNDSFGNDFNDGKYFNDKNFKSDDKIEEENENEIERNINKIVIYA